MTMPSMIHHAEAGVPLVAMPRATQASSAELATAKHSAMTILAGMEGFFPTSASRAHIQVKAPARTITASELGTRAKNDASRCTPKSVLSMSRSTNSGIEL